MKKIPKGFRLKFHNNMEFDTSTILKNCSMKIMKRTVSFYKSRISDLKIQIRNNMEIVSLSYSDQNNLIKTMMATKSQKLNEKMQVRRKKKFERDGLDIPKAVEISEKKIRDIFNGEEDSKNPNKKKKEREDILQDVEIPSHDPIVLTSNPKFQDPSFKSLCAKGPSFVPTPTSVNWTQLQEDFDKFSNLIRREIFFAKNPQATTATTAEDGPPRQPSSWQAPKTNIQDAESFLKCVERDIFADTAQKKVRSNLSEKEQEMLKFCRSEVLFNPDSTEVLRLQDKGNKIVVVDKPTDIQKSESQIANSSIVKVDNDPTELMVKRVGDWCEKWTENGHLSKEWASFILNEDAKPAKNNPLYKTHKNGTPVRLLTSGCGSATENLSLYAEKQCSGLAQKLKSRIRDTAHMLEIIDDMNEIGPIPDTAILVSLDVENMFPSIDNERGLETIRTKLDTRREQTPPTDCIIEALEIILTSNNSVFNGQHLVQTNGTATGSKNSCSYSDLAMEPIDDAIYRAKNSIFRELITYFRYRDDCFLLWNGSLEMLKRFVYFVNILDPSLRFTVKIGRNILKFMDLYITLKDGYLYTTVYSKPTDGHLYLDYNSCHPRSTKTAVQTGVALRLRRICSSEEQTNSAFKNYQAYLVSRNHPPNEVVENFEKVKTVTRNNARKRRQKKDNLKKMRFFTEYNPRAPKIFDIIKKHEHFIRGHEFLKNVFPPGCFQVVHRRAQNLKELIMRADPYTVKPQPVGCYNKCGECDSCMNFVSGQSKIKVFATGRTFVIRRVLDCETPNVVYAAECLKCGQQGVGSTVKWKPRMRNYKSHIRKRRKTCRISRHFIEDCRDDNDPCGHIRFHILDCLDNVDGLSTEEIDSLLLEKEKFWIKNFVTVHKGMNSHHDLNRKKRTEMEKFD